MDVLVTEAVRGDRPVAEDVVHSLTLTQITTWSWHSCAVIHRGGVSSCGGAAKEVLEIEFT